jgi:hypothetical protein
MRFGILAGRFAASTVLLLGLAAPIAAYATPHCYITITVYPDGTSSMVQYCTD